MYSSKHFNISIYLENQHPDQDIKYSCHPWSFLVYPWGMWPLVWHCSSRRNFVWPLCMSSYTHFTSHFCIFILLMCAQERENLREREGRRVRMDGQGLCECGRRRRARWMMTSSRWLQARKKRCFSLRLFYTLFPGCPRALYRHQSSGWERLACIQEWPRGVGDMAFAWEPLSSPQEISSNEVFLCQASSCVFYSGENKLAR